MTVFVVLRRLRLDRLADPATQPPGAFPRHQRAGCPRVALTRVNPDLRRRWPIHRSTEALFQSPRLPAQSLCESYAAKAAGKIKAMPVAQTRPAPGLARPCPERFLSRYREQRAIPSFDTPPRFYLRGSRSSRSFLAAIHLEPLQFYLFGLLEKILSGLRGGLQEPIKRLNDVALLFL